MKPNEKFEKDENDDNDDDLVEANETEKNDKETEEEEEELELRKRIRPIEFLARRVLVCAGIPLVDEDGADTASGTFYLTKLEKLLDVSLVESDVDDDGDDDDEEEPIKMAQKREKKGGGQQKQQYNPSNDPTLQTLLTCTTPAPISAVKSSNTKLSLSSSNNAADDNQYWTPSLTPPSSTTTTPAQGMALDKAAAATAFSSSSPMDIDFQTLEDYSPFSAGFYTSVGELLCEAYNPTISSSATSSNTTITPNTPTTNTLPVGGRTAATASNGENHGVSKNNDNNTTTTTMGWCQGGTTKKYSLTRHHDAVRVTRILRAMMDMNVIGAGTGKHKVDDNDMHGEDFIDMLLFHCEGNAPHSTTTPPREQQQIKKSSNNKEQMDNNNNNSNNKRRRRRIPIVSALYRHVSSLPALEQLIHTLTRYNPMTVSTSRQLGSDHTMVTPSAATTTATTTPTTHDRLVQMQTSQHHKEQLESELTQHVSNIEILLGQFYQQADVPLRSKCRVRMGGILHHFVLTSTSPSLAATTTSSITALGAVGGGGGGGGVPLLGIENTSACGIPTLLRVLYRIISGFSHNHHDNHNIHPDYHVDCTIQPSHEHLLFQILVPLHKPSSMVLWRDQTPLLGLYHEPLTQCMGVLMGQCHAMKKLCIGRVVNALLHPDIWPTEGGRGGGGGGGKRQGRGGGGGAVANTPKVVLLLHEVDTYLGLLDVAISSSNQEEKGEEEEETRKRLGNRKRRAEEQLQSMSETMVPLTLRLAASISSDNSRTSERALQYFKNKQFQTLVQYYYSRIIRTLIRALCRVDSGMDVPWNPTVRKMSWLVLKELEGYNPNEFERVCESIFGSGGGGGGMRDSISHGYSQNNGHDGGEMTPMSSSSSSTMPGTTGPSSGSAIVSSRPDDAEGGVSISGNLASLRSAMGDWRPPSSSSTRSSRRATAARGAGSSGGEGESSAMPPPPSRLMKGSGGETSGSGTSSSQPPLTVTGVAPWAMGNVPSGRAMGMKLARPTSGSTNKKEQPPVTITGVAPWAIQGRGGGTGGIPRTPVSGSAPHSVNRKRAVEQQRPVEKTKDHHISSRVPRHPPPAVEESGIEVQLKQDSSIHTVGSLSGVVGGTPPSMSMPIIQDDDEEEEGSDEDLAGMDIQALADSTNNRNEEPISISAGLAKVRWYMDQLKPPKSGDDKEGDDDGMSSWAKAQMAESPVLLPRLKFHDLVFGQTLGTGAFSTVKYARQIVKDKTRSDWPEFAVKVVSTQKIEEMGYERSINREIAILRILSHPGIARLISSFRFRDGAYLVLEYASGGDLHTLLRRNGSLDHESTKFVVGEIVAALWSVHEAGFVYGDLKPENILIHESGHIKVTDFGACRPFTDRAREILRLSGRNLLRELRDGDWRENKKTASDKKASESRTVDGRRLGLDNSHGEEDSSEVVEEEEDHRIEGTTAYLPPEVVIGGVPTTAADVWALGCLLYQCLSGRPPHLEDTEWLTRHKIVTFDLTEDGSSGSDDMFFGHSVDGSAFHPEAKALIKRLLRRNAHERPNLMHVAEDLFFERADVFSLHKHPAHPLDVGNVKPVEDAKWSRRQFSSIWAPQPQTYVIGSENVGLESRKTSCRNAPIREGEEAEVYFFTATRAPGLTKITE